MRMVCWAATQQAVYTESLLLSSYDHTKLIYLNLISLISDGVDGFGQIQPYVLFLIAIYTVTGIRLAWIS